MGKNKSLIIGLIIFGVLIFIGGGILAGMLISNGNYSSTAIQDSASDANTEEVNEPTEQLVGKTGECNTGEVKYLSSGTYTVGTDIAYGEYLVQNDNKHSAPYVSLYVYPSETSYETDEFNDTRIAIFEAEETRNLKLDDNNYMRVVYGGKLTCW